MNTLVCTLSLIAKAGFVEHHKRSVFTYLNTKLNTDSIFYSFDPAYSDAKARAASLGEFNFFSAWMSQPKSQLETFRAWAGKDSDIRCAYCHCPHSAELNLRFSAVITSPRITSIFAAGSFKISRSRPVSSRALRPESRRASRTTACLRQKTPLRSWLTGSQSRARSTRVPVYTRPAGQRP
jgi:hypothetical protein